MIPSHEISRLDKSMEPEHVGGCQGLRGEENRKRLLNVCDVFGEW